MSKSYNPSSPVVENKLPESTNFDLSCGRATTMAPGVVTPIYVKSVLPGDKWQIKPALRVRTLPLATSLMGSFTFRIAWFFESDANLYGYLSNDDSLSSENLASVKYHYFRNRNYREDDVITTVNSYWSNAVGPGSLLNYLYFPVGADASKISLDGEPTALKFSLDRFLGFIDIYRNFYVNRQVERFPYIVNTSRFEEGYLPTWIGHDFDYSTTKVSALDDLLKIVRNRDFNSPFDLAQVASPVQMSNLIPYMIDVFGCPAATDKDGKMMTYHDHLLTQSAMSGLPLCCLRADIFTRMMNSNLGKNQATVAVNTTKNNVTVNSIISASRLQAFINNIDITGGRISDWMRFRWGVDIKQTGNKPICLGVDSITLDVNDLRTTSTSGDQAAATQVGYIDMGNFLKKISFNNKTGFGGNLYAICTIVPNVYYSEGIEKDILDTEFFDKYNPEFANENFVDIAGYNLYFKPLKTISGGSTTYRFFSDVMKSVGRTTSWWNYQTDVNRSFSLLSKGQSMEGWLLNRTLVRNNVSENGSTGDSLYTDVFSNSPYCFPSDYAYCFADTAATAQNFIVQFAADINVRRLMPSYNQPKIF